MEVGYVASGHILYTTRKRFRTLGEISSFCVEFLIPAQRFNEVKEDADAISKLDLMNYSWTLGIIPPLIHSVLLRYARYV